jgi:hypothetical protein
MQRCYKLIHVMTSTEREKIKLAFFELLAQAPRERISEQKRQATSE